MEEHEQDHDTMICISATRHMMTSSAWLRDSSPFFESLLSDDGTTTSASGYCYAFVLQNYDIETGEVISPVFRRVKLQPNGTPRRRVEVMHEGKERNVPNDTYGWYEKIIKSFAPNARLTLPARSMPDMLHHALGLIKCADAIRAVHMVAKDIESTLLAQGKRLYLDIASNPLLWIDLGHRLSSKLIFREALIYVVGHRTVSSSHLDKLESDVKALVLKKSSDLTMQCREIDAELMALHLPETERDLAGGQTSVTEIGRPSYSSDIYAWQAVTIFRQWFGQLLAFDETHAGARYGYETYKMIHLGRYLTKEDLQDWHEKFPMTAKGKNSLYKQVEKVREMAKAVVEPLFVNESSLTPDPRNGIRGCFTCTLIDDDEYPWAAAIAEKAELAFGFLREAERSPEMTLEEFMVLDEEGDGEIIQISSDSSSNDDDEDDEVDEGFVEV